jgi:polyadenylate-binding protein 2
MSDAEIEQKREEDERLDTAEDPNEEVRHTPPFASAQASHKHVIYLPRELSSLQSRQHTPQDRFTNIDA